MDPKLKQIDELAAQAKDVLGNGLMRGTRPTVKEVNTLMGILGQIRNAARS